MIVKDGADCRFMRPELTGRLWTIEQVFLYHAPEGYQFVITSGTDGKHAVNSLHYKGLAVDCRRWYWDNGQRRDLGIDTLYKIRADLRRSLGTDWDIVLETSHVHIEYDPKGVA